MTTRKPTCQSETDWLAFCYAAGELPEHEAEQFEARLATDQAAREALARAVELTQTIVAAEEQTVHIAAAAKVLPAAGTRRTIVYERVFVALGLAAAVLLALNLAGLFEHPAHSPTSVSPHRAQLAAVWSQTRSRLAADDSDAWPALEAISEFEAEQNADLALTEVTEAPSWLTAALLGQMSAAAVPDALNEGPVEN